MIKVLCDEHRPMRFAYPRAGMATAKAVPVVECERPECQELMARRRLEVESAGAPTEEQKAVWRAQLPGRAVPKALPGGKA